MKKRLQTLDKKTLCLNVNVLEKNIRPFDQDHVRKCNLFTLL